MDAQSSKYQQMDLEIRAMINEVFCKRLKSRETVETLVFQHLDKQLGTKKTQWEARNYKKLLAGIQKAQLLDKRDIDILFSKADRFLDKKSVKKEKQRIKTQVQEKLIAVGVKP